MKKYDFSVGGIPVSVYPSVCATEDRRSICEGLSSGEYAVLTYPDLRADCYAVCFDKNNEEPREPYICLAALSCLFDKVLGYPKMSIDVNYRNNVYRLSVGCGEYNFSVNVGKCKILCTKTVKFADGIEIEAYTVDSGKPIIALMCEDAELFDRERLRLLFASSLSGGVKDALAISYLDKLRVISLYGSPVYEAVPIALSLLRSKGVYLPEGESVCELDGVSHVFCISSGKAVFRPSVKYIS